jgi:hypothetical protein
MSMKITVRPELVEGRGASAGTGFDKLSPNGREVSRD